MMKFIKYMVLCNAIIFGFSSLGFAQLPDNNPAVPPPSTPPSTPPPNQGFSLSMSGGSTISEGYQLTFTITVGQSGGTVINPQWTVTTIGSPSEVLKGHTMTVSESGLQADVVFYWYPGNNPGLYKVEFSCENPGYVCSVDKIVTCTIPKTGAVTIPASKGRIWEDHSFVEGGYSYVVLDRTGYTTSNPSITYNIPWNSPFREGRNGERKIELHEQQHFDDYEKPAGGNSLAGDYAAAYLAEKCASYYGNPVEFTVFMDFKRKVCEDAGDAMLDWMEERAYAISDPLWPTCYYTGNPRAK